MTIEIPNEALLSDADLLNEVKRLTALERQAAARLIAALGELDARRLYLGEGYSSLFTYCTQVLHLSEHAAYLRIEAARAARKWPGILVLLADGALHLTAIGLLAPHLTADNQERVLAAARHKSKREVEMIVAALRPQPAVVSSVRRLPSPSGTPTPAAVVSQPPHFPAEAHSVQIATNREIAPLLHETRQDVATVKALAPERYKVQFTVSGETHEKLCEAQNLLRHRIPDGDVAAIFERALTLLLNELHKTRHALVERPRMTLLTEGTGRHIPASVKRAVWARDSGQCAFVGAAGRCSERGFLEYHHRIPFADGGATRVDNLELRCRAHNAFEAERWSGVREEDLVREVMAPSSSPW
jgi:5-methylcytosine-specific restriction endonuclease McrA